jgi:hypothetical protein
MSLRLRLIGLVCGALVVSLILGGAAAWFNATRSVRTEMRSPLLSGDRRSRTRLNGCRPRQTRRALWRIW